MKKEDFVEQYIRSGGDEEQISFLDDHPILAKMIMKRPFMSKIISVIALSIKWSVMLITNPLAPIWWIFELLFTTPEEKTLMITASESITDVVDDCDKLLEEGKIDYSDYVSMITSTLNTFVNMRNAIIRAISIRVAIISVISYAFFRTFS